MRTEIANSDLGNCPSCGIPMEKGEWVSSDSGVTRHTGCLSWRGSGVDVKETTASIQSGFLFAINDQTIIDHAKETLNVKAINFDGASCLQVDAPRLALQLTRVFELMKDAKYRTLREIANATGCLETSASARLRDLRKPKFGGHSVDARRAEGAGLIYEYRLTLNEERETETHERRSAA